MPLSITSLAPGCTDASGVVAVGGCDRAVEVAVVACEQAEHLVLVVGRRRPVSSASQTCSQNHRTGLAAVVGIRRG
jgi:hypothetical protein